MHIRAISQVELHAARELLAAAGWEHRADDLRRFDELVANSQVALVAIEEGRVVGFVRALTDGISNGYISMLAVAAEHRNRGIGSALVRACMGDNEEMTWVLRAGRPGLTAFYEKLGYSVSSVAMERPRRAKRVA